MRRGRISAAEAETSPQRHVLLQAIGAEGSDLDIEIATVSLEPGDRLLLASDGLSGMVRHDEIRAILTDHADPDEAVRMLIEAANDAGGQDNITVLIVEAQGEPRAGGAPGPVLVEKPTTAKPARRFRPTVVLGAVLGIVVVAAIASFFVFGVSAKSYVVSSRRAHVVVLRGHPGTDDEPATGKVVREYRDKPVDRYAVPAQRELEMGIKVDSLSEANRVIANLPQKLGANERATPSPSPAASPVKSPAPKTPAASVSPHP